MWLLLSDDLVDVFSEEGLYGFKLCYAVVRFSLAFVDVVRLLAVFPEEVVADFQGRSCQQVFLGEEPCQVGRHHFHPVAASPFDIRPHLLALRLVASIERTQVSATDRIQQQRNVVF